MSPRIAAHPPSKTCLTVSSDEIPPQPLPPAQDEAERSPLRDTDQRASEATAFYKLPVEVVQRILWTVDANTFASLVLLNRAWYKVAQDKELYAHHLSRCPSYALANTVITGPFRKNDLLRLKSRFAAEVRRNLFEAYLRPRRTLINLISVNASSSAALPGAEAFRFSFSPNGRTLLALSSSRIYVLDATDDIITVRKELKTTRRPLSASITDDGSILAVLSSKYQANIYHLDSSGVRHVQVLVMDNPPRTISLAPEGTVLAAAYEGGVEVFSLAPNALPTDRRAVRSEGVDILRFSGDGSMLVGSTQSLDEPSAVVITAPFYTENDIPPKEVHSRMWTTQILFPQISSICSHAELLPGHTEGDANWLFAYDHSLMTYRAVRTDDTRTGVAYFLNPPTNRRYSMPLPSTAPTATACGTLVVAGFAGSGLWVYGVPEKLDLCPDMGSVVERHAQRLQGDVALTSATGHLEPLMAFSPSISGSSDDFEDDSLAAKVDWRESLFVKCQQIQGLEGCTAAKWVERPEAPEVAFPGQRLIVVAPGGAHQFVEELGDETMPVDGSSISILDFDYSPCGGQDREITIEVGDNEPELLPEQISDMDIEVVMERRRTVRDRGRGGAKLPLGRSRTAATADHGPQWAQRRTGALRPSSPLDVDTQMALVAAESQVQRQSPNLSRSVTAAGFTTARYPPRPPLSSQQQDPAYVLNQPHSPDNGYYSPPPPYAPNPLHSAEPDILVESLVAQPRHVGTHGPMGMTFEGIPGDGHHPSRGLPYPAPQGFDSGYLPAPQRHPSNQIVTEDASAGRPVGQHGSPAPSTFQHAPITLSTHPSPPFGLDMTGDPSSPPGSHHQGRNTPSGRPGRVSPLDSREPTQGSHETTPRSQHYQKHSLGPSTLSGANLQARLNHPVPPIPPTLEQMRLPQEPASQTTQSNPTDQYSAREPNALDIHHSIAGPTPDQMANLNRRFSQSTRKPLPLISTNGDVSGSQIAAARNPSGGSGVPPSAPRAAWGAAGVPGSPSFNKATNVPDTLSRSSSRGSGRSIPFSASTPNLHSATGGYTERPRIGRLDTIESVSSSYGPGEPGSRPHIVTNGMAPYSSIAYTQQLHSDTFGHPNSTHQARVWAGSADGHPDIGALSASNKKKGKRRKGESISEREQTMPMPSTGNPSSRKERRCAVM